MSRKLTIRGRAKLDIAEAAVWYEDKQQGLGGDFTKEVHSSIKSAAANPEQFPRIHRTRDVRRVLMNRFAYKIVFIVMPDAIVIWRILHTARGDQEWKKSL